MTELLEKAKLAINKTFPFMELPLSISRQGQFPLDKSSIWWSKEEAEAYATTNPIAYPGQPITVVNEELSTVTFYLIGVDGTLVPQGSAASVEELKQELAQHKVEYNALKQAHDELKAAHDQLKKDHDTLREEFDAHDHTADEISETATRVWLSPEQRQKLDDIAYATNADIDELFKEHA